GAGLDAANVRRGVRGARRKTRNVGEVKTMAGEVEGENAIVPRARDGDGPGIAPGVAPGGAKTQPGARPAPPAPQEAARGKKRGGEALPCPGDLTKESEIVALFKKTVATYGRLDVLVNNAGIATHKNTEDITLEYWNDAMAINMTAPFLCAREAIRIMKEQKPQ